MRFWFSLDSVCFFCGFSRMVVVNTVLGVIAIVFIVCFVSSLIAPMSTAYENLKIASGTGDKAIKGDQGNQEEI